MEIELYGNKLKVFEDGTILHFGKRKPNKDIYYEKWNSIHQGYKQIQLCNEGKYKMFKVHRIIGLVYKELDINDSSHCIDHIDRNRANNHIDNLRLVTHQQNHFNKNSKGCYYYKRGKTWKSQIKLNGKNIHIGYFATEQEAHAAYLVAKQKYHIMPT
tara:strand:+ start:52 stop:525 length:474 start_codon:yes stop_codon:yes gene_type:complete